MKSVLITDLDNTLFDWFRPWHASISTLLDGIEELSGLPRDKIIREIKKVHQTYGTAEYEFLIQELPSLRRKHRNLSELQLLELYDRPIRAAATARASALTLYPGVLEMLTALKEKGVLIVGYTESQAFYTGLRIKRLGLDGIIDILYSPESHKFPQAFDPSRLQEYALDDYQLSNTITRYTPQGEVKPNPQVLLDIVAQINAMPGHCIYVGDSLTKDIRMAQDAGITDIFAEYGVAHRQEEYQLLREVTHWTAAQVKQERLTTTRVATPSYTLRNSFEELSNWFEFVSHKTCTQEELKCVLDVWKTTVDVQKHFNDLSIKARQLAATILSAFVGGIVYLVKEKGVDAMKFSDLLLLTVISSAAWLAFYIHDRQGYHRLLKGSVLHGVTIENAYKDFLPMIGLSASIGRESRFKFLGKFRSSNWRVSAFYAIGFFVLLAPLACYLLMWVTGDASVRSYFAGFKDLLNSFTTR